jgi:glycosyltransferase involved in cell wall biosynthesis
LDASLIIPAHNEQQRLPATLSVYRKAMHCRFGRNFEIIVMANGCTDDTVRVARKAAISWPQIRVIDIAERVGKGGAVLEGFRQADGQGVAFADADAATAPYSLLELYDELDRHDIVIGSRRLKGSIIERPQPFARRACGLAFAEVTHLVFGMPFKDTQCGAKALRSAAARRLSRLISETRWTFDLELLLLARRLGLDIYEYPVAWADQDGSQLRYASTAVEVLRALWGMKLRQSKPLVELPEEPIIGEEYEREPETVREVPTDLSVVAAEYGVARSLQGTRKEILGA